VNRGKKGDGFGHYRKKGDDMKKNLSIFAAICFAGVILAAGGLPAADGPIIIGGINDLSADGSVLGNAVSTGAELAVDEINAAGGVLGRKIEYIAYDNQNKADQTINAYARLVDVDKAVAIVGPPSSTICMSLITVSTEKLVPVLCVPSDPNVTVNAKTGKPYPAMFLSTQPNAIAQGQIMADFMYKEKGSRKVGIFYDAKNSYSTINSQSFKDAWISIGGEVTAMETFQTGDNDFKTQLTKIKNSGAQFIYVPNTTPYCVLIVQQAAQVGLAIPYVGAMDMAEPFPSLLSSLKLCKSAFFPAIAWMQDDKLATFRETYRKKFGEDPTLKSVQGYEMVYIIKHAIESRGAADAESIRLGVENDIVNLDLIGVNNYTQSPETHSPMGMTMIVCEIKDGVLLRWGDYTPTMFN
jgi:branched-chain amino acid transport system substrate-binding protein